MEEHPLFEQGDACPAIRLPLQQFEAMDKAFRWPVAPRQSELCLYGRLLFVQIACKCLQFRLAMLLHFFQPPHLSLPSTPSLLHTSLAFGGRLFVLTELQRWSQRLSPHVWKEEGNEMMGA